MRIISNERDYYDGFMNYNKKDRFNKVWVRKERKIGINKNKLENLERRSLRINRNGWDTGYLILAGKVVPFVIWNNFGYPYNKEPIYFYDAESADKFYRSQKKSVTSPFWRHRYWDWEKSIKKHLVEFFKNYTDRIDLCVLYDTPIILITPNTNDYKHDFDPIRNCFADINLKGVGLSKIYKAPIMYQKLDFFISNVLINDDMPNTPMTEKEKMQQHGFTHKYSFRKEPSKRNN